VAALLAHGAPATAQSVDGGARRDLDRVEREMADRRARAEALAEKAAQLRADLDALRHRLVQTAGETQAAESAVAEAEERLAALDGQEKAQLAKLDRRRNELEATLHRLSRLARRSPTVFLASTGSTIDTYRGIRMMGSLSVGLAAEARHIRTAVTELAALRRDIDEERRRRRDRVATLTEKRTKLSRLLEEKSGLERRTLAAKKQERRNVARLSGEARDLRELIDKLAEEEARRRREAAERAAAERRARHAREIERRRRAAEQAARRVEEARRREADRRAERRARQRAETEARRRAEIQARRPAEPPPRERATVQPRPPIPTEKPRTKIAETKPMAAPKARVATAPRPKADVTPKQEKRTAAFRAPGPNTLKIRPRQRFSLARGKLPMPARGRVVRRYGSKNSLGQASRGILVETLSAAQVVSPFDGEVVYAGTFRDYGLLLIISLGEGYHILLSGMSRLYGAVGQSVLAGEPIAEMAAIDAERPRLYVELRRRGEPINPLPWMSAATRKVSG
jgi:septal ring factor EnvC (AmiA/AmiB activator)